MCVRGGSGSASHQQLIYFTTRRYNKLFAFCVAKYLISIEIKKKKNTYWFHLIGQMNSGWNGKDS
jgi:hypothetical protein